MSAYSDAVQRVTGAVLCPMMWWYRDACRIWNRYESIEPPGASARSSTYTLCLLLKCHGPSTVSLALHSPIYLANADLCSISVCISEPPHVSAH